MAQSTEAILETALKGLLAEQARIEKKVRVLKSALAAVNASETDVGSRTESCQQAHEGLLGQTEEQFGSEVLAARPARLEYVRLCGVAWRLASVWLRLGRTRTDPVRSN